MNYTLNTDCAKADVTVIGGGTAGVFAAICAAKAGAKTLLVEKNGVLGGTVTAAGVSFPGLFTAWGKRIIDGPCYESILRTAALGGAVLPEITPRPLRHYKEQIDIDPFIYAAVLDEMCMEAGVEVYLHTMLADATEDDGGVTLLLSRKEAPLVVKSKKCIDCTGDANLITRMGYPTEKGEQLQPATLIHRLSGYVFENLDEEAFRAFWAQKEKEGLLTPSDYRGGDLWWQLKAGRINMHLSAPESETSKGKTGLEQRARARLVRILSVLKGFPGLENIRVASFAKECGVRESVRIVGQTTVTAKDYIAATPYPDGICFAFYPIDRHDPEGIYQVFLEPERVPQIPYRALIPQNSHHLLAAGRCVSADRDAQSAIRVQAPCMAMGQASGVAAAIAAGADISVGDVPIGELKEKLKKLGAVVPA